MAECSFVTVRQSADANMLWFRAEKRNSNQAIPANSLTDVTFDTEQDPYNQLTNSIWTCQKQAVYLFTFSAYMALTGSNNSLVVELLIQNNNVQTAFRGQQFNDYPGSTACLTGCVELNLSVGATAKVRVYSSNASNIEVFPNLVLTSFTAHQLPTVTYEIND